MVALLLAALFQSAAPATTVAAPSAPPPAKTARLACRKQTVVGSTIKKKVCPRKLTEELAQEDRADAPQLAQAPAR